MTSDLTFPLYSTCIPVKGYLRSIIYDLERNRYDFIPNVLYEILVSDNDSKSELINKIPKELIKEYHTFLMEKCYLNDVDTLSDFFPKLKLDWDFPAQISNSLVELSNHTVDTINLALTQLNNLGCNFYQLIITDNLTTQSLNKILNYFKESDVKEIQLIIDFNLFNDISFINNLPLQFPFCNKILIFNSPHSNLYEKDYYILKYTTSEIRQLSGDPKLFNVNLKLFTESLHFNTFYNRKIIIDRDGKIVPFLGSNTCLGYIDDDISQIIKKKEFNILWHIKKDDIAICKDCEFRYMCVDSRVPSKFLDYSNEQHNLTTPCTYNPYKAEWLK